LTNLLEEVRYQKQFVFEPNKIRIEGIQKNLLDMLPNDLILNIIGKVNSKSTFGMISKRCNALLKTYRSSLTETTLLPNSSKMMGICFEMLFRDFRKLKALSVNAQKSDIDAPNFKFPILENITYFSCEVHTLWTYHVLNQLPNVESLKLPRIENSDADILTNKFPKLKTLWLQIYNEADNYNLIEDHCSSITKLRITTYINAEITLPLYLPYLQEVILEQSSSEICVFFQLLSAPELEVIDFGYADSVEGESINSWRPQNDGFHKLKKLICSVWSKDLQPVRGTIATPEKITSLTCYFFEFGDDPEAVNNHIIRIASYFPNLEEYNVIYDEKSTTNIQIQELNHPKLQKFTLTYKKKEDKYMENYGKLSY